MARVAPVAARAMGARKAREYDVTHEGAAVGTLPIPFRGIAPVPRTGTLGQAQASVDVAAAAFLGLRDRVHWLNSLRAVPPRLACFGVPPTRLAPDGLNAGDYLAHDAIVDGALVDAVSAAFEKITRHPMFPHADRLKSIPASPDRHREER